MKEEKSPVKLPEGHVVAEEVAVKEVKSFIVYHKDKTYTEEKILDEFPDLVLGVQKGVLMLSNMQAPILKLKEPITKGDSNEVDTADLTFKTRINPSTQETLARGIDFSKEQIKYLNICKAYYAGLATRALLDKLSKFDLRVIEQLTTLFT